MAGLEQEFQDLVEGLIKQINDKVNLGKLSGEEAHTLREMVEDRLGQPLNPHDIHNRHYESPCPEGRADPDCGWSSSMGYHCF